MPDTHAPVLLSLDQGTTSTRAVAFDRSGHILASHQIPLRQSYPADGWVEHDATEIWEASRQCLQAVYVALSGRPAVALGITNQRETTVLWDRRTGAPVAPAIVWQDRRTAARCAALKDAGHEPAFTQRTGLLLDPYFSGTKLAWLLDNIPDARTRADRGELAFGTVDSWLLFKLTGGAVHATDATNASRTLLFNLHTQDWDPQLLDLLNIPKAVLPEVRDTSANFGDTSAAALGFRVPIGALAGDQQAAAIGQACFSPGLAKSTYGTGCFALTNTGTRIPHSANRLLATQAYRLKGQPSFAIEGSIFMAGATIQWLRDSLGLFANSAETAALAASADPKSRAILVPAFVGLGAPYWDPDARGALLNLTRADGKAEIARAALESVSFQTRDLTEAMAADMGAPLTALRVDGGMVVNDWFCQNLADLTGLPIERPAVTETTALGAAYAAGLASGVYAGTDDIARNWRLDRRFHPAASRDERDAAYARWKSAVARVRGA